MTSATPYRHRYRQIVEVLAHHGLGYLVGILGLARFVPFHRGLFGHPRRALPYTRPDHLRLTWEELGTTCIKLGQILSTRADLVPPDYQTELAKLQDAAPWVPTGEVQEVITSELGRPIAELFATFDSVPLAAASIGQAHAATLPDGTEVVVKVRRPGVVELVEADLEILQTMAKSTSQRWELAAEYDLVGLAQEFAQSLRTELDYLREASNAERFAASFADDPTVHVPRIFHDHSTSRVLTLERVRGIKIDDLAALDAAGIDRRALAERASKLLLKMVFEDGFFHADRHPGNLFVEDDGRIGLIDFGMVGELDERMQERLADVLLAVTTKDTERLVDVLLDLGVARKRIERKLLRQDLDHFLTRYYGRPMAEMAFGPMLRDILSVVRHHHLHLPANLALLFKMLLMAEGLAATLDPSFNLWSVLPPYAQRLLLRQYAPTRWVKQLTQAGLDATRLGVELPRQLHRIIADWEHGGLEVGMRPVGLEPVLGRLERLANRIVLGVLAAAFVIGLAILMAIYHPPGYEQWVGLAFAIGFGIASTLGLVLAWTILRSGRG